MTRHLDGRASLRSHPCPQRWGEELCPLISAGLLPGGQRRDMVRKEPCFLGPMTESVLGEGCLLAGQTSHPSPASPPWSQAPQACHSHSSMASCMALEKPLPLSVPSLSTGETVTALDQRVRGSPEPPRVCWQPRKVPTPGMSQSSRAERTESTGDSGRGWDII